MANTIEAPSKLMRFCLKRHTFSSVFAYDRKRRKKASIDEKRFICFQETERGFRKRISEGRASLFATLYPCRNQALCVK